MKVVLVSLARRGGMLHFLAELANALAPMCHVSVVVGNTAQRGYFDGTPKMVRVDLGKGGLGTILAVANLLTWYRLWRRLSALEPDLVHVVGVHELNPAIGIITRFLHVPLIYTVHDPEAHPGAPRSIRWADSITARLATHLVVLTNTGRNQLIDRGFTSDKISVIIHPVYTLFRRWASPRAKTGRHIVFFGRLEAYKGIDELLEAYSSIRGDMPGWTLTLVGSGLPSASLSASRGPNIRVINRYVSDRLAARLMSTAAIVVLPYTSGTQSGIASLAQAFDRPVIASRVGGMHEMVIDGRTGILVPPGDVAALAEAMRKLSADPKRLARMRRLVARQRRADASPRNVAKAHMHVYSRILEAEGGAT